MMRWNVCKLCSNDLLFTIRKYRVNSDFQGEWGRVFSEVIPDVKTLVIRLVACSRCGFLFYREGFEFDELSQLYKTEHRIDKLEGSLLKRGRKWEIYSMLNFFKKFPGDFFSSKTAIDIGAGDFSTLDSIKPLFSSASFEALDPSYGFSEYKGVLVHDSMLEDFVSDKKYEVILAIHILEHVSDIRLFMKKLHSISERYLYVEVPYQVGPGLLRNASVNPQHINYFTPESLTDLLEQAGFRIVLIEFDDDGYRHIGMPGMIRVLAELSLGEKQSLAPLKGSILSLFWRFFDPRPLLKAFKKTD